MGFSLRNIPRNIERNVEALGQAAINVNHTVFGAGGSNQAQGRYPGMQLPIGPQRQAPQIHHFVSGTEQSIPQFHGMNFRNPAQTPQSPQHVFVQVPGVDPQGPRFIQNPNLKRNVDYYLGSPGEIIDTHQAKPPMTPPYVPPGWTYGPVGTNKQGQPVHGWRDEGGVPGVLPNRPVGPDQAIPGNDPFERQNARRIHPLPIYLDTKKVRNFQTRRLSA